VLIGTTALDAFAVQAGERQVRRVPIAARQLGEGDTIEITIAVDRTFVPASMPELRNSDTRELGVRVYRAFVRPS
jgi:hypothetical protein